MNDGGYDIGYKSCACFWGTEPGSLIYELDQFVGSYAGLTALDIGCGEGKNAAYLARRGASVKAIDISAIAIQKARDIWSESSLIDWVCADIREEIINKDNYDLVIQYGVLHCFNTALEVSEVIQKLKCCTRINGYHILCTFNNRCQDLSAHPGFSPILMPHGFYTDNYSDWDILFSTDTDLYETHPHNGIPHTHSMSRLIARKKSL